MKASAIQNLIEYFTQVYQVYHDCLKDNDMEFTMIVHADTEYTIDDCNPDNIFIYPEKNLFKIEKDNYTDTTVFLDIDTITSILFYAKKRT